MKNYMLHLSKSLLNSAATLYTLLFLSNSLLQRFFFFTLLIFMRTLLLFTKCTSVIILKKKKIINYQKIFYFLNSSSKNAYLSYIYTQLTNSLFSVSVKDYLKDYTNYKITKEYQQRKQQSAFAIMNLITLRACSYLLNQPTVFIWCINAPKAMSIKQRNMILLITYRLPIVTPAVVFYKFNYSLIAKLIISSLLAQDPFLLLNWLRPLFDKKGLFGQRKTIKTLLTIFKFTYKYTNTELKTCGILLTATGKISVSGNSRSRTMIWKFGKTSFGSAKINAHKAFHLITTETGCVGFSLIFFSKII